MRYKLLLLGIAIASIVVLRGAPNAWLPPTNVPSVSAQEDFIVTIGQDKVFTEYNYYDAWFDDDPNNLLPWPDQREAYSEDNVAHASLSATPGHAGVAHAWTGVQFEWDLGDYSWEEVEDWPVTVTFDVSYEIEAYWTQGTGSANAEMNFDGLSKPWYDGIGYETGYSGSRSRAVTETFTTNLDGDPLTVGDLEALERILTVEAFSQAHSTTQGGATNYSSSEVQINSIEIEFGPIPPETYTPTPTYTPTATATSTPMGAPTNTPTPRPAPVGGFAEYPQAEAQPTSSSHGASVPNALALSGLAAGAVLLLAVGGWHARRRWLDH